MDAMRNEILDFEDSAPFTGNLDTTTSHVFQVL